MGECTSFSGYSEYLLISAFYSAAGGITIGTDIASIKTISNAKYELIADAPSSTSRGVIKAYKITPVNLTSIVNVSVYVADSFIVLGLQ